MAQGAADGAGARRARSAGPPGRDDVLRRRHALADGARDRGRGDRAHQGAVGHAPPTSRSPWRPTRPRSRPAASPRWPRPASIACRWACRRSIRAALHFLGREHSLDEALAALETARRHFARYSFDLIYARPGQTPEAWAAELERALALAGEHLSLYQLTIERGTRFFTDHARGAFTLPGEEEAAAMFELTQARLAAGRPAGLRDLQSCPAGRCLPPQFDLLAVSGLRRRRAGRAWPVSPQRCQRRGQARDTADQRTGGLAGRGRARRATARRRRPVDGADRVEEALMMGLRLADGIDRALFASMPAADPVTALGEPSSAPLVDGGFPRGRCHAPQGDGRRTPAPQRAPGAPDRMRLAASCWRCSRWRRARRFAQQKPPAKPGPQPARQARVQVAVHAARLQDHHRHRGRLSAVQLSRPQGPAGRLRDGTGAGGLPAHQGGVRVRRLQVGRSDPRPDRQEVRRHHVLARGQQRAAPAARHVAPLLSLARRLHRRQGRSRSTARPPCCATSGSACSGFHPRRLGRQELPSLRPDQALQHAGRGA